MKFTIEERGNCVLVHGTVAVRWLTNLPNVIPNAVFSPELARMTGANFAFGLPADVKALIEETKPKAMAHVEMQHQNTGLSAAAKRWLAVGERGVSSNTIFTVLTGVNALEDWSACYPHDPADVRRCRLLLEQVPELQTKFPTMAAVSQEWKALVENWATICTVFDREAPDWRDPDARWSAPKTYQLIQKLTR